MTVPTGFGTQDRDQTQMRSARIYDRKQFGHNPELIRGPNSLILQSKI
jgi:hypothetical protein